MGKRFCPRCFGRNIVKAGIVRAKNPPYSRRKYKCKDCGKYHVYPKTYKKKHGKNIVKDILKLSKLNKGYKNKYDNRKSERYSTREISRILSDKYKKRIGKSYVHNILSLKRPYKLRRCKRCSNIYKTIYKLSKICPECYEK